MRVRSKKPTYQIKIAKERIRILFSHAERELDKHPERSSRYIELARKIALRYNIRLGKLKREFCRACNTLLKPGKTAEVQIDKRIKTIKCLKCNRIYRYPLDKK